MANLNLNIHPICPGRHSDKNQCQRNPCFCIACQTSDVVSLGSPLMSLFPLSQVFLTLEPIDECKKHANVYGTTIFHFRNQHLFALVSVNELCSAACECFMTQQYFISEINMFSLTSPLMNWVPI